MAQASLALWRPSRLDWAALDKNLQMQLMTQTNAYSSNGAGLGGQSLAPQGVRGRGWY